MSKYVCLFLKYLLHWYAQNKKDKFLMIHDFDFLLLDVGNLVLSDNLNTNILSSNCIQMYLMKKIFAIFLHVKS